MSPLGPALVVRPTRVLAVLDEGLLLDGLRALFDRTDDHLLVGWAVTGEKAVALVRSEAPDVVLMDGELSGSGAVAATRALRAADPAPEVLVVSSSANGERLAAVLRAGAAGYLLKRCPFPSLLAAVDAVAAGSRFFCREIADVAVRVMMGDSVGRNGGVDSLSDREREVLALLAEGLKSRQIASRLGIGVRTVEDHRSRLMEKLDIHTIAGLTKLAIRFGLTRS